MEMRLQVQGALIRAVAIGRALQIQKQRVFKGIEASAAAVVGFFCSCLAAPDPQNGADSGNMMSRNTRRLPSRASSNRKATLLAVAVQ